MPETSGFGVGSQYDALNESKSGQVTLQLEFDIVGLVRYDVPKASECLSWFLSIKELEISSSAPLCGLLIESE